MSAPSVGTILSGIGIVTGLLGTASSVSSYNSAGDAALSAAQYNSKLIDLNLNRELDSISRELRTFSSSQQAQIAASGVSVSSKSSLVLMNEALTNFENEAVIAKENAKLQKETELFAAKQQQQVSKTQGRESGIGGIANAIVQGISLFDSLKV